MKEPISQDIFCHFLDTYRNMLKNPLNEMQFEGLSITLFQIMNYVL